MSREPPPIYVANPFALRQRVEVGGRRAQDLEPSQQECGAATDGGQAVAGVAVGVGVIGDLAVRRRVGERERGVRYRQHGDREHRDVRARPVRAGGEQVAPEFVEQLVRV